MNYGPLDENVLEYYYRLLFKDEDQSYLKEGIKEAIKSWEDKYPLESWVEGFLTGWFLGIKKSKLRIVKNMINTDFSKEDIIEITNISEKDYLALLAGDYDNLFEEDDSLDE